MQEDMKPEPSCTVPICKNNYAAIVKRAEDPASLGNVVDVILQRYFNLMEQNLGNVWRMFTNPEMCLLIEACGASCPSDVIPDELRQLIRYSIHLGRANHWGVRADTLLSKVGRLTTGEWLALVDISQQAFADESLNLRAAPTA